MLWLLYFLAVATALAYHRVRLQTATAALAVALLFFAIASGAWGVFFLLLFAGAAVLVPLNVAVLRQEWITRPAFALFKRVLPELSETERIALEAGTVWWDGELFSGHPDWA